MPCGAEHILQTQRKFNQHPKRIITMNLKWTFMAALAIGSLSLTGCKTQTHSTAAKVDRSDEIEPGETKVSLDQTPPAVRDTIKRELANAELEDISKMTRNGKTIYETDLIKNGQKWELVVAEDGSVI